MQRALNAIISKQFSDWNLPKKIKERALKTVIYICFFINNLKLPSSTDRTEIGV